jgi:hypothetical protein
MTSPNLLSDDVREREQRLTTADLANRTEMPAPALVESDIRRDDSAHDLRTPLFVEQEAGDFRLRWRAVQADFVDDPRAAVQKADELVANAIQRLAEIFAGERSKLEGEWSRGQDVSTEDLRQALRRYRSFFDRLLSA